MRGAHNRSYFLTRPRYSHVERNAPLVVDGLVGPAALRTPARARGDVNVDDMSWLNDDVRALLDNMSAELLDWDHFDVNGKQLGDGSLLGLAALPPLDVVAIGTLAALPAPRASRRHGIRGVGVSVLLFVALLCQLRSTSLAERGTCSKSMLELAPVGLFYPLGAYCGPSNGREYRLTPVDGLDATCAIHDHCIENSDGLSHLYPKAERAADDEAPHASAKCGVPLGAWRNVDIAHRIAECDLQMLRSLAVGRVLCPAKGERLPRSHFCDEFEAQPICAAPWRWLGVPVWGPRGVFCAIASAYIGAYERYKVHLNLRFHTELTLLRGRVSTLGEQGSSPIAGLLAMLSTPVGAAKRSPPQQHRQSASRLHESARALDSYDLRLGGAIDLIASLALLSGIS
jgi:hypothetical protein